MPPEPRHAHGRSRAHSPTTLSSNRLKDALRSVRERFKWWSALSRRRGLPAGLEHPVATSREAPEWSAAALETQRKLRRYEERYRLVNQATRDLIWDWDVITGRLEWNEAARTVLEGLPENLSDTFDSWAEKLHPEDRDRVLAGLTVAIEGRADSWSDEYRLRCRGGTYRAFLDRGFIARDPAGRAYRMIGSMLDVHERHQAEATVRGVHDLLTGILDGSNDLIAALDQNYTFLTFNRAFQAEFKRLFGVEVQVGARLHELMAHRPDDLDCMLNLWSRALQGEEFISTHEFIDPEQDLRAYEMRFSSIRDRDGHLIGAAHIVRDITERKRMEDRLRVTQFAVDRASDAVFWVDSSGRFLYTNDAACRSLGYTREELLRMSVPDIDPVYGPDIWPSHWQELQTQGSITFETVHQHKSGKRFPVEVTVNYLPLNEKEYLFAFVRNIAPRKAAEDALKKANAELARSNAELERFASTVSHDLRSPMLSISGHLYLLQHEPGIQSSADAQEAVESIRTAVEQMNGLLKGLLDYARVGRGGLKISEESLETDLHNTLANLKAELENAGAHVTHDPLPVIRADHLLLTQLFQNLIGNAIKYRSEAPPEVHISARPAAGEWIVSVSDNGIGIAPEYTDRIFGMFQRLHVDESRYTGMGVGLALCKKIAEQHGGRIWVDSQPGKGSTFHFSLPQQG